MQDEVAQFHRRSIRYTGYDYALPGAYFVTIVTMDHKCIFGKFTKHKIQYYILGDIVIECWKQIPNHFMNICVEPFVIMPNHVHGIITINDDVCRGTIYRAPTNKTRIFPSGYVSEKPESFGKPTSGSLSTIIRTYKAAVSRIASKELSMVNIWQRNYYEHIVRDERELENITAYILTNQQNWINDPEYRP